MKNLQLHQLTGAVNTGMNGTFLREGDEMILYKQDGVVRFSRDGRSLYGQSSDDKCFIGKAGGNCILAILFHLGISTDFVREDDYVEVYRLGQPFY